MPAKGKSLGGSTGGQNPHWVSALRDAFPDVEWVDSDLDIGEGRAIDRIGIDPAGRIVFVLHCDGTSDSAVITVLDAMVFFERNRSVLAQHLRSTRVRASLGAIVALIADSFSEQLLARLCNLDGASLRLFELRQLSSARGERAYLIPIAPSFGRSAQQLAAGPESFLATLADSQRALGALLVDRIGRIDDQLSASVEDHGLSWRLGEELVCSISQIGGAIEGQVAQAGESRPISEAPHVEAFVDRVLGRYVGLLSNDPLAQGPESSIFSDSDAGMTLTAEEIAAFRQSG